MLLLKIILILLLNLSDAAAKSDTDAAVKTYTDIASKTDADTASNKLY